MDSFCTSATIIQTKLIFTLYIDLGNPAVRSVTLNSANKFSQCTFSVAEHYDLFSGLIILMKEIQQVAKGVTIGGQNCTECSDLSS